MAGRSILRESGTSNDKEAIDSGWSSNDNLTNVTSIDETSSTISYPMSTISIRNNMSETMSLSTTMDCSTLISDTTNVSNNISMVSTYETRVPSVTACHSYTGPYVLMKDYEDQNESSYSMMCSYPTTAPEDMFPPYQYQPTFPDKKENDLTKGSEIKEIEQSNSTGTSSVNTTSTMINYSTCCLSGVPGIADCGPSANARVDWSAQCVTFGSLDEISVQDYLVCKGIISDKECDYVMVSEKDLIANRLERKNVLIHNNMVICPKHRNSFGIGWHDQSSVCHHPQHNPNQYSKARDCRRTNLTNCRKIEGFPIGGRLCSTHRKLVSKMIEVDTFTESSYTTHATPYEIDDSRDRMNRILDVADMSPIKSQTNKVLKNQSKSSIRRLLAKLQRGTRIFQDKLAETLAPGEGNELVKMSTLNQHLREDDNAKVENNEIIDNIKRIYNQYIIQNMPFAEQVRLLSLLPRSWTYNQIMIKFNCSRHAVKIAHRIRDDEDYYFKKEEGPATRQCVDPERIRHFITWLVDSQLLVSGSYGVTTLKMDDGEKCVIPKQILQSQRTHAIVEYLKYCEETNFDNLGKTKLFQILDGIKPSTQRIVSGLDEFVTEGIEGWNTISNIVANLPIPQIDRKRLKKQIEMAETYQKIHH